MMSISDAKILRVGLTFYWLMETKYVCLIMFTIILTLKSKTKKDLYKNKLWQVFEKSVSTLSQTTFNGEIFNEAKIVHKVLKHIYARLWYGSFNNCRFV